jgi:hypothetical protein
LGGNELAAGFCSHLQGRSIEFFSGGGLLSQKHQRLDFTEPRPDEFLQAI